jgi:hypothetical protein
MTHPQASRTARSTRRATFATVVMTLTSYIATAWSSEATPKPASQPLDEVVISAQPYDRRTLDHVIIPHFIESHSAPSTNIDQVARWRAPVCPLTTGLQPAYNEFVARRITMAAQSVGAPNKGVGQKCNINIEIVFTPTPQVLLDHLAKSYPTALGSARSHADRRITRPIQAWYLTGTHAMNGWNPPVQGLDTPAVGGDNQIQAANGEPGSPDMMIDQPDGQGGVPGGLAGSHLSVGLRSEFQHVLIIVNSNRVQGMSLAAIADYISMISLTRIASLDTCNELPSIIDLLSSGCGPRPTADSITAADTAFLQALYGSDLEKKLNIEQGEMRDRMLTVLEKH